MSASQEEGEEEEDHAFAFICTKTTVSPPRDREKPPDFQHVTGILKKRQTYFTMFF